MCGGGLLTTAQSQKPKGKKRRKKSQKKGEKHTHPPTSVNFSLSMELLGTELFPISFLLKKKEKKKKKSHPPQKMEDLTRNMEETRL